MRTILKLITAGLLLWAAPAESRDLISSDVNGGEYPAVEAVDHFGKLIAEKTSGRLVLAVPGVGSRTSEAFSIAAVRSGTQDMARVNITAFDALLPEATVMALPYLFRSTAHLRHVIDGPIGADLLSGLDRLDLVGLCLYDPGARSFYGDRPVRKAADLTGLKVRGPLTSFPVSFMKIPGMTVVPMPFDQVSAALGTGAIDLAENTWPAFLSAGRYRVAKYYSLTQHSNAVSVLIFSKRTWQSLSEADRAILQLAANESVRYFRQRTDAIEADRDATAKALGVEIITDIDRQSFADAMAVRADQAVATPSQQDLIKRIRATR